MSSGPKKPLLIEFTKDTFRISSLGPKLAHCALRWLSVGYTQFVAARAVN
jgi:hypothetical protein